MLQGSAWTAAMISSAVVAAIVGAISSFLTQRYLMVRKAQLDDAAMTRQAHVEYESMARRRLYESIGPLRMQLLFAARDVIRRTNGHVQSDVRWNMDPGAHYGRSTIYRLLRPLAIAQLIEQKISVVDFAVDPDALELLKFGVAAERMLSSDGIVLDHPNVDWGRQTQHLFRDNLRAAASRLIDETSDEHPSVYDYERFQRVIPDLASDAALRDLAAIIGDCRGSFTSNPILWLRLVGYAHVCAELLRSQGEKVGFDPPSLTPGELLKKTSDAHIVTHTDAYVSAIAAVQREGF